MTASMTVAPRRRSAYWRGWKAGPFGEHPNRLGAVQSYSQAPAPPTGAPPLTPGLKSQGAPWPALWRPEPPPRPEPLPRAPFDNGTNRRTTVAHRPALRIEALAQSS